MDQAFGGFFQQRPGQAQLAHYLIVGQHREDRVALKRVFRRLGGDGALGGQLLRPGRGERFHTVT